MSISIPLIRLGSLAAAGLYSAMRVLGRFSAAIGNRRDVVRLAEADPAMLRDIGLTPFDLDGALSEPFWRDPSDRLLHRAIERRDAARAAARDNLIGLGR